VRQFFVVYQCRFSDTQLSVLGRLLSFVFGLKTLRETPVRELRLEELCLGEQLTDAMEKIYF
jgi:hypothetical protein